MFMLLGSFLMSDLYGCLKYVSGLNFLFNAACQSALNLVI